MENLSQKTEGNSNSLEEPILTEKEYEDNLRYLKLLRGVYYGTNCEELKNSVEEEMDMVGNRMEVYRDEKFKEMWPGGEGEFREALNKTLNDAIRRGECYKEVTRFN